MDKPAHQKNSSSATAAVIQMNSQDNVDQNLKTAQKLIRQAAKKAKLVVLPENFAFMGAHPQDRLHHQEKLGSGKIQDFLASLAHENNLWIVGGTIPIAAGTSKKVKATSLVYDNNGRCVGRYDKINLFDAVVSRTEKHQESSLVEPGKEIVVLDSPLGKLGLAICFDVRFPMLFLQLAKLGAEIIALPSAFTVPTGKAHWEILTRCRAIDTFSYVLAAGQYGTHPGGRKTYGHSLIVDPWGRILAQKKQANAGVIYAEIDLQRVKQCRKSIEIHFEDFFYS